MNELTPNQQKAATLLGSGTSCAQTARECKIAVTTLSNWRKNKDFRSLVEETLHKELSEAASVAMQVLKKQLHDENKYVAQNAARDLLTRYDNAMKNKHDGTVEIVVHGGPELGMPSGD